MRLAHTAGVSGSLFTVAATSQVKSVRRGVDAVLAAELTVGWGWGWGWCGVTEGREEEVATATYRSVRSMMVECGCGKQSLPVTRYYILCATGRDKH